MRVTRSYSTKTWVDKQGVTFIVVSLLILYLLPSNYLMTVSFISDYVRWLMNIFRIFDVVAARSDDYVGYAIYFALLPVLFLLYSYIYYKKPIKLNFDVIDNNKLYYFLVLTFFVPFIIVGIVISLTYWENDFTFILVEKMVSVSSGNKAGLILIFGGICIALSYLVAGYIAWSKYILVWLSDTEGCERACSIMSSSISLFYIVSYVVSVISFYNSILSMLIESLVGDNSGGRILIIFIVCGFVIITTLFITACSVFWKHSINLIAHSKRREQ